jgi:hypothetical protein
VSRDPRRASDWPAQKYPYLIRKPRPAAPTYHTSFGAAIRSMEDELRQTQEWLGRRLGNQRVVLAVDKVLADVRRLPRTGGTVKGIIDPDTQSWCEIELVYRDRS